MPIAGFVQSFIDHELPHTDNSVKEVALKTVDYFKKQKEQLTTQFIIAGYEAAPSGLKQVIYQASVQKNQVTQVNVEGDYGAYWNGDIDVFYRLIKPLWAEEESEKRYFPLNQFDIHFSFFTLQDAVDFAVYAIRTTIDSMRFQARNRTVGGPIDVLIIKPDQAYWLQRKELHV